MSKALQEMLAPTLTLGFCVVAFGIALAASPENVLPARADLASRFAFPLVVASWVMADARRRGRRLCHDYDSFVFFVWPILVPIYLFQTRGVRAFLTLLCFAGICALSILAAAVVFMLRE